MNIVTKSLSLTKSMVKTMFLVEIQLFYLGLEIVLISYVLKLTLSLSLYQNLHIV